MATALKRHPTLEQFRYIEMMARKRSENSGKVKNSARAKIISSRTVFRGPVFTVVSDKVREPGGITARRDVIRHSGSVVVLAVDEAQNNPRNETRHQARRRKQADNEPRVLLERQYRYAAKDYLWELPAGRIDPGESELAGAKRELLEETGYTASSWKPILKFYVSPGFLDETMVIYLARGLREGKAQPEEDELISVKFWPLAAALRMIERNVIRDAKTITGLFWLASKKMRKSS